MKLLKSLLILITFCTGIVSCSKNSGDDGATAPDSVQGQWQGSVVTDATKTTAFYALNLKSGGALDLLDEKGDIAGSGYWSFEDKIMTGSYKNAAGTKISLIGAYNNSLKKILGNWGYGSSVTNGGTYELKIK